MGEETTTRGEYSASNGVLDREIEDAIQRMSLPAPAGTCDAHSDMSRAQVLGLRISKELLDGQRHMLGRIEKIGASGSSLGGFGSLQVGKLRVTGMAAVVMAVAVTIAGIFWWHLQGAKADAQETKQAIDRLSRAEGLRP